MSGIQAVSLSENKPYIKAKNTGYIALAGLGVTTAIGFSKNKSIKDFHKPFGLITAALALMHLGVILHNQNVWKKKQITLNENNKSYIKQSEGVCDNETSGC